MTLAGTKTGGISLAAKSPAPWKDGGEWNYDADKKGNPITDPSQLTFSFTKATGIFTGSATAYFDYETPTYKKNAKTGEYDVKWTPQHKTAKLPFNGVMVLEDGAPNGYGVAVYSHKTAYEDDWTGKRVNYTEPIVLPVTVSGEIIQGIK